MRTTLMPRALKRAVPKEGGPLGGVAHGAGDASGAPLWLLVGALASPVLLTCRTLKTGREAAHVPRAVWAADAQEGLSL
jgi:hypothetical protein